MVLVMYSFSFMDSLFILYLFKNVPGLVYTRFFLRNLNIK